MQTTEKTCFKCQAVKPITEFYRHARMGDGHLNKCKSCAKADMYESRHFLHRDRVLAYDRLRASNQARYEKAKAIQKTWYLNFPERKSAQTKLRRAVLSGEVQKLHCFLCGSERVEAHHPDYSRPLDVVWLCPEHHRQAHAIVHYLKAA